MSRPAIGMVAGLLLVCAVEPARATRQGSAVYNVRGFGARGDGTSVDSDAINKAIDAAAAAGGGTVDLPAGRYLSSMRDIVVTTMTPDSRPPLVLHDVGRMLLDHVDATRGGTGPFAALRDVFDLNVRNVNGVADGRHAHVPAGTLAYQPQ